MIRDRAEFDKDLPAGFDGVFDWDVFKQMGCWGDTRIEPMDFDGVVERHRHYLVFETKQNGASVPLGQSITLENLHVAKSFTVVKIWPKSPPFERMEIITQLGTLHEVNGHDEIVKVIKRWFISADEKKLDKIYNRSR